MRSRAISRERSELFEGPVERCAKAARAMGNELERNRWTVDWRRRRLEHLTQRYTNDEWFSSWLEIDLKRGWIKRRTTRSVIQDNAGEPQKVRTQGRRESKRTLDTFLMGLCSSYVGSLLFRLTEVVLPLTILILSTQQ